MKKFFAIILILILVLTTLVSCDMSYESSDGASADQQSTINIANKLQHNQPTPTDIDYSLERYNLIRRAY